VRRRDSMKNISFYGKQVREAVKELKREMLKYNNNSEAGLEISEEIVQWDYKGIRNIQLQKEISESSYLDTVKILIDFLDRKDQYTKRHCARVTKFAVVIGQALELSDMDLLSLELAALLHDIGKLVVPNTIINKEGRLTIEEYEMVKIHPIAGYELIEDISFLDVSRNILLQHHERVDGKGYPLGLNEELIDVRSKILSIADAYDAMTSSRPYRKEGLSMEEAICQLEHCRGSQFDTNIVDVFIDLLKSGEAA
jgi:putative nucleotidyltransferase with HDIG domain